MQHYIFVIFSVTHTYFFPFSLLPLYWKCSGATWGVSKRPCGAGDHTSTIYNIHELNSLSYLSNPEWSLFQIFMSISFVISKIKRLFICLAHAMFYFGIQHIWTLLKFTVFSTRLNLFIYVHSSNSSSSPWRTDLYLLTFLEFIVHVLGETIPIVGISWFWHDQIQGLYLSNLCGYDTE